MKLPTRVSATEHAALAMREVDDLHHAGVREDHVLRRDVPVDEAERRAIVVGELVRVVQPGEHLDEHAQVHREQAARSWSPLRTWLNGAAVEELHGHEVALAVLPDLVRLHHVGVGEPRGDAGLVEEHAEDLGIVGEALADLLDDHDLVEARGAAHPRQVDVGHAALPEVGEDAVPADARAVLRHRGTRSPNPAPHCGHALRRERRSRDADLFRCEHHAG